MNFTVTVQKISIDWGDSTMIEEVILNGVSRDFGHEYPNENHQTITVNTLGQVALIMN